MRRTTSILPLLIFLLSQAFTLSAQAQALTLHINEKAVTTSRVAHVQELPTPDAVGEFVFMGWSTSPILTTSLDLPQLATTLPPDLTNLYAVYRQELECTYFQEVEKLQANKEYIFAGRTPKQQSYVALNADKLQKKQMSRVEGTPIEILPAKKFIILPPISPSLVWNTNVPKKVCSFMGKHLFMTTVFALKEKENINWEKPLTYYDKTLKSTYRAYVNSDKKFYMTSAGKPEGSPVQVFEKTTGTLSFYTTQPAYSIQLSEGKYATFSTEEAVKIPAGVQAFSGTLQGGSIKLQEIYGIIPANTGVVLKSLDTRDYIFEKTRQHAAPLSNNVFIAAPNGITAVEIKNRKNEGTHFVLAHLNNRTAFYKLGENINIPPHKAYLLLSNTQAYTTPLTFELSPMAIMPLVNTSTQLPNRYDLSGRIITSPQRGQVYILNGQKHIAP